MAIPCTDLQSENREEMIDSLDRARLGGRTMNVMGGPGVGKSEIIGAYAKRGNHWFVHVHWGKMAIHSAGGIAHVIDSEMRWSRPDHMRLIEEANIAAQVANDDPSTEWKWSGWVVVLYDEVWNAHKDVTSVALEMFNERRVGEYLVPDNVQMICAGNRAQDGAHAFNMAATAANRMAHVNFAGPTEQEWVQWGTVSGHIDPVILGYIQNNGVKLIQFDKNRCLNATPRSYEIASDLLRAKPVTSDGRFLSVMHKALPREIAADMLVYYKLGRLITPWDEIIARPESARLPSDIDASQLTDADGNRVQLGAGGSELAATWFTLRMIAGNLSGSKSDAKQVVTYVKRLAPEFQSAMLSMIMASYAEGVMPRSVQAIFTTAFKEHYIDLIDEETEAR